MDASLLPTEKGYYMMDVIDVDEDIVRIRESISGEFRISSWEDKTVFYTIGEDYITYFENDVGFYYSGTEKIPTNIGLREVETFTYSSEDIEIIKYYDIRTKIMIKFDWIIRGEVLRGFL